VKNTNLLPTVAPVRLKVCGLTKREQCLALAHLGVHALGFICVPSSPRYVSPTQLRALTANLPPFLAKVGVFADAPLTTVLDLVQSAQLTAVQLHGQESPEYCEELARQVTGGTIIKALRLKSMQQLAQLEDYWPHIDALLLDAYHPTALGGTGQALPWLALQHFQPPKPWILAGGITPENIRDCLALLSPDAIDVSSGVEFAPGDKDPQRVAQLLAALGEGSKAI